jgi:SAM-dependent methyltransferase
MNITEKLRASTPEFIKKILRPVLFRKQMKDKFSRELNWWRNRFEIDGGFNNSHFQKLFLLMAGETNGEFLRDKVVADFGCGPRGSLCWAKSASLRIGIDVLADRYADIFTSNIISHGMIYLKCTEKVIPLPSDFVDIIFTLNAIDHVDNLPAMCSEIIRVLKAGGNFIGGFNLEEPPSVFEPQMLNEAIIKKYLLDFLEIQSYRITKPGPGPFETVSLEQSDENLYAPFLNENLSYESGEKGLLWVRAKKN